MKATVHRLISIFLILSFIFQVPVSFSAEVLMDKGQRQTVVERTKQYAGHVDAIDIRAQASQNFQKNLKVHTGGNITGQNANCGGYTTSTCGIACCGKEECEQACTANKTLTHGNDMCLSDINTSWCGMSCCGKEDCDTVCYNYRTTTATADSCGGYIKTATGESCCGLDDCRNKSCGGFTSVISADFGVEMRCCGEKNCDDIKCDYSHITDVISGGTAQCCGTKDCYSKYCEEMTEVDSKVYPDQKNLPCCGKVNCHEVECDGYTQTNTPSGIRECCGYEDCRNKECQYRRSAKNANGQTVACCGIEQCGNIESKSWEEPDPNAIQWGHYSAEKIRINRQGSDQCWVSGTKYIADVQVGRGGTVKVTTGVATKIPQNCSQTSIETYDGINYYHYKCKSALPAYGSLPDNVKMYSCNIYRNSCSFKYNNGTDYGELPATNITELYATGESGSCWTTSIPDYKYR